MKTFMRPLNLALFFGFFCFLSLHSQTPQGHTNTNKFKQLYDQFADPNKYHNASGAPGVDYYQQKVDYTMDIELDDKTPAFMERKQLLTPTTLPTICLIYGCN